MPELEQADPITQFANWLQAAEQHEPNDPNAMALASVGSDGMPSLRMVLLKAFDPDGFVFYTNLESRKGGELLARPQAALLFHWKSLRRQVRIEGAIAKVTDGEADAYFQSRDRMSKIGAWASKQSRPLDSRAQLEQEVSRYEAKFDGAEIPRPPYWHGLKLVPNAFEFWQDGAHRIHDRWRFEPTKKAANNDMTHAQSWASQRLFP